MENYQDMLDDGLRRVITPFIDPKVGVIVTTEYFNTYNSVVRRDVHVEVSKEAMASGRMRSHAGSIGG